MQNSKLYFEKGIIKNWNSGILTQTQVAQIKFYAKTDFVKFFQLIIRAISYTDTAIFQINQQGIKIIVEEATSVQTSVYLKNDAFKFSEYRFKIDENEDILTFAVDLRIMVENLNLFAEDDGILKIMYKKEGAPLIICLENEADDMILECLINTKEYRLRCNYEISDDDDDSDVVVQITFNGPDFYNFINDIFKAGPSSETLEMIITSNSYQCVVNVLADSTVEYIIDRNSSIIMYYKCDNSFSFKYKSVNMKLLLKSLQIAATTTIRINKNGLMSVRMTIEDEQHNKAYIEFYVIPLENIE